MVPLVRSPLRYLLRYATNSGYADFVVKVVITVGILLREALSSQEVILIPCSELLRVCLMVCSLQKPT